MDDEGRKVPQPAGNATVAAVGGVSSQILATAIIGALPVLAGCPATAMTYRSATYPSVIVSFEPEGVGK